MADEHTLRSRTHDPYSRNSGGHDTAPASDPLAELARLIGQSDPFGNLREVPAAEPRSAHPPVQHDAPPTGGDWRQHIEPANYMDAPPVDPHDDYRHDAQFPVTPVYADERLVQQIYDDPPGQRSSGPTRSGLAFAGVLACCAVIGSAGAYGYRTLTAEPATAGSKPAPVIVADKSPSKIVPPAPEQKARSQDRLASQGERLAPAPEQPAPLPGTGSPRIATAPAPAAIPPATTPPAASAQAAAPTTTGTTAALSAVPFTAAPVTPPPATASVPPSTSQNEPKRIRTVPIRPEGGSPSARPSRETARSTQTAKTAPSPARGSAPLSLDPAADQSAQASAPRAQPRPLTPPAPREAAPSAAGRVASLPANGGDTGGYVVQVSSQRSEADARASYRGLQQKYPQLKSKQPLIRRADLGKKGTYYRAMIGPFDSAGEAEKFCSGLRSAGGQCIVVRN